MGSSPSVKETTLHHYRDPLASCLSSDPEVDFLGVVLQATSDSQQRKEFMAHRTGHVVAGMHPDGVMICIDAWGNAHIDFCAVIESIGKKGIPLTGLTFSGVQAAFVVTNRYMENSILDLNKNPDGMENGILGDNTVTDADATNALKMLKRNIADRNRQKVRTKPESRERAKLLGHLAVRRFQVRDIVQADRICYKNSILGLHTGELENKLASVLRESSPGLRGVISGKVSVIRPEEHDLSVNSILDVSPIAVKKSGPLGEGVTHLLQGVQVFLTAVEEDGYQPINCGAAIGKLKDVVRFGRCGTPAANDFLIHVAVVLEKNAGRTREGIMAAHLACDLVTEEIRECLRHAAPSEDSGQDRFLDVARPGRLRMALVKMTSGVSAMGDTALFPVNPGGFIGAKSVIELLGHFPVVFSPNEYRDGIVHSLT